MRWLVATLVFTLCAVAQQDLLSDGQQAFASGDLARAETLFREHLRAHPADPRALSNLAAVYSRRESYPEAVKLYREAIAAAPQVPEIRFNLAVALLKSGHAADATSELRTFLKARPKEIRARQLLGVSLLEAGDFAAAIKELEQVRIASPNDPSVVFALAIAHARGGDEEQGKKLIASLDRFPAQARLLEGLMEYRAGRFDEARAKFVECLRYDSNQAPAVAALGRLYLLEKKDDLAIEHLERALRLMPQDAESTYQLGVLYDRNGDTQKGRTYLRKATSMRAGYADPYYQLARILHRDGEFPAALEQVELANRLLPNHESIRFLKGRILQSLERRDEAREEFEAVRKIKAQSIQKARQRVDGELTLEP
ncbi:MAG: tetratricopeptide repeat protein [Bryobacterales bacterium]|nr:tetratricopeptide repeat protein [Bryobacterales bacterium]